MKKVYLDNAATTQIRPEVIAEMAASLASDFGNPSSTHSFGRQAKSAVELSRKSIAKNIGASAQEILFTSGATEATNWLLRAAVTDLRIKRIVTSKIEHHAVLHVVDCLVKEFSVAVDYVEILQSGAVNMTHLTTLLSDDIPSIVCLMHVNNEIGTVLCIEKTARLCKQYGAYFFCDTVQSVGKTRFDLQQLPVDFMIASAHKFHGPKGIGFAFIRKGIVVHPILHGGEQEKGMRAGTEPIHNIVGMAKALEIAMEQLDAERTQIESLKNYAAGQFKQHFPGVKINGEQTFYNILNVCLPMSEEKALMILFNLDMKGIAVSRGSACQSGSSKPSHVLAEMLDADDLKKPSLRISFSHYNSEADIDYLIETILAI